MIKVVVINGMPGCGKTTFEEMCGEYVNNQPPGFFEYGKFTFVRILSTVDFVKSIAKECGWDGSKTLRNRKFLSDLKDLLTEWDDVPFKVIKEHIDREYRLGFNSIIFVDCREPKEIQKLKDAFNATTVLIRRPAIEKNETSNHADAEVFDYEYDLNIWNEYGLEELKVMASTFIEKLRNEDKNYEYVD